MDKFYIVTDSTADLTNEVRTKYDIIVLDGHMTLPDGHEVVAKNEWDIYSRDEFYEKLKECPDGYKTSPPNVKAYYDCYKKLTDEGCGVLDITISAGISGSFEFMNQARNLVLNENPKAEIVCIDSRKFGPSIGLLAIYASIFRSEGCDLYTTAEKVENIKNRMHQAGWLDDLSFVAKKGRITHASAFMGTLVGIKPIGDFDSNGLTSVLAKVKGSKQAMKVLAEYMAKTIQKPEQQIIVIAQTNRYKQAEEFMQIIKDKFNPKDIYINDVFPSCGANIGPGLMAAYYIGNEFTPNLTEEKEIMNKIINGGSV